MIYNIKLLIEYDGTNYHGWQRQASPHSGEGDLHKTVQGTLEDVLSGIIKNPAKIVAAGRTDAGVHAKGQVVHFKTELHISESSWIMAMNSQLPPDIVVKQAEYVPNEFNARFDAKSKVYRYIIFHSLLPSPFHRHYVWHIRHPLRISVMREASQYLIGHHDFSSFRSSDCSAKSPVKTLDRLEINATAERGALPSLMPSINAGTAYPDTHTHDNFILLTFEARSYLQHMVRNIVGSLAEVGKGKICPSEIEKILGKRDRRYAGPIAPPQGLYLEEVRY